MTEEVCEITGCNNESTRITATETKYIVVCDSCYYEIYRS